MCMAPQLRFGGAGSTFARMPLRIAIRGDVRRHPFWTLSMGISVGIQTAEEDRNKKHRNTPFSAAWCGRLDHNHGLFLGQTSGMHFQLNLLNAGDLSAQVQAYTTSAGGLSSKGEYR